MERRLNRRTKAALVDGRFRDALVWTVGLTGDVTLRFRDALVWTVDLTGDVTLRFRDALVLIEKYNVHTRNSKLASVF